MRGHMFGNCKLVRINAGHSIRRYGILAAIGAAMLLPQAGRGQGTAASLGGIGADATGAVTPNATVAVTNNATGDKRPVHANGAGVFSFSALPVGRYQGDITATG